MANRRRIQYSVFKPEFISHVVRLKWGWERARCEFWNHGTSDTYRIERRGDIAYLKIYPYRCRRKSEIQGEIDLLRYLGPKITVSNPIINVAGRYIERVSAPEGHRYAVLFSEAKGTIPEFNPENCRKFGQIAGTIHNLTNTIPGSVKRPTFGIEQLAREPLRRIQRFLVRRPRDFDYLKHVSEELADAVSSLLPFSLPEFGMCHGDLTFGNVRRDEAGRFTVIDFDYSGFGWRAYDVAVFLWSRGFEFSPRQNARRLKQWNAFMDGYHTVRTLSSRELQAVNLLVPLRQIWQLGVHTNQLVHVGSRETHEARFETHLQFIRNWLENYAEI